MIFHLLEHSLVRSSDIFPYVKHIQNFRYVVIERKKIRKFH